VSAALAVSGWLVAIAAAVLAAAAGRALARQRELAIRVAHELRGPLTAIGLGLDLAAREGGFEWPRRRVLELELARAATVVGDLTSARASVSRRRAGGVTAHDLARLDRIDIATLVRDCVAAAIPLADLRGVALRSSWSGGPAWIWGDRQRLAQVLHNLLANAIEHGGGQVEVSGRAERGLVRLDVTDAGPGLPAPVVQLIGRARPGVGHRGRGLAIATEIVERHGGRLGSAPTDRGARLTVELPCADRRASSPPTSSHA
jgi:signal transduction histidine kinase